MKKRYLSFLAILALFGLAIVPTNSANAASNQAQTVISGYVIDTANKPIANADVSISCLDFIHGDYMGGGHDTTDSTGAYLVILPADQCPKYGTVLGGASDSTGTWYAHGRYDVEPINTKLNISWLNLGVIW
jgi:hypothetical protein